MGKLKGHWWNLFIWTFVHFTRSELPCSDIDFPIQLNCEAKLYRKNLSLGVSCMHTVGFLNTYPIYDSVKAEAGNYGRSGNFIDNSNALVSFQRQIESFKTDLFYKGFLNAHPDKSVEDSLVYVNLDLYSL